MIAIMTKLWKTIKHVVAVVHKAVMCIVHLRELTRPNNKKSSKLSLSGFLATIFS